MAKHIETLRWSLIGMGGLLFSYLFWEENLGVNTLLLSFFALAGSVMLRYDRKTSAYAYGTGFAVIYTALMLVLNASFPAKLALFISGALAIGFAQEARFRTVFYAAGASMAKLLQTPTVFVRQVRQQEFNAKWIKTTYKGIKLGVIPLAVTLIFWWIFRAANPVFNDWMNVATSFVGDVFMELFGSFSLGRTLFLIFGLLLSAWFFAKGPGHAMLQLELSHHDEINRERTKYEISPYQRKNQIPPFPIAGLRQEYRTGMLMMAMVTSLAGFVNMIDIVYVWFGFEYQQNMDLSQFVHEGTYLLILSILLSMGIMLYFFRGNLNFYLKQDKLRWVAYTWIVQNTIMCVSVGIRNYQYIHYCGLTYKRIGVYCFLALTLFGLAMLFIKIKEKKSAFYLFRTNAWALYGLVLFLASFNWDNIIAEHNVAHWNKARTPYRYLASELSDKALPILHRNREQLEGKMIEVGGSYSSSSRYMPMNDYVNQRIEQFVKYHNDSWLSWTWAESNAYHYFCKQPEYDVEGLRSERMEGER